MSGWILLWRKIRENPLWKEHRRFSKAEAWIDLLMDAHWRDEDVLLGGTIIRVMRGQALFSQRKKSKQWGWARGTTAKFISMLEKAEMVSHAVSRGPEGGYTLLTINNYEKFQALEDQDASGALSHDVSHVVDHGVATVEPRLEQRERRERKGMKPKKDNSSASGLTLDEYLAKLSSEGQEVLRQTVNAIASTRESGKVSQSILDHQARKWNRFVPEIVLKACRVYLDRRYANEGKDERYLLGIIRQEAKRSGNGRQPTSSTTPRGQINQKWAGRVGGEVKL